MDLMNQVAAVSMEMHNSALQEQVSISLQKKVMDAQELAGQELLAMLPPAPPPAMGEGAMIDLLA